MTKRKQKPSPGPPPTFPEPPRGPATWPPNPHGCLDRIEQAAKDAYHPRTFGMWNEASAIVEEVRNIRAALAAPSRPNFPTPPSGPTMGKLRQKLGG